MFSQLPIVMSELTFKQREKLRQAAAKPAIIIQRRWRGPRCWRRWRMLMSLLCLRVRRKLRLRYVPSDGTFRKRF